MVPGARRAGRLRLEARRSRRPGRRFGGPCVRPAPRHRSAAGVERRGKPRPALRRSGTRRRSRGGRMARLPVVGRGGVVARRHARPRRDDPVARPGGARHEGHPSSRPRRAGRTPVYRRAGSVRMDGRRRRQRAGRRGPRRRGHRTRRRSSPPERGRGTPRRRARGRRGAAGPHRRDHRGRGRPMGAERAPQPTPRDRNAGRLRPRSPRRARTKPGTRGVRAHGAVGTIRDLRRTPGWSGRRWRHRAGHPNGRAPISGAG